MSDSRVLVIDHCAKPGGAQLSLLTMGKVMPGTFDVLLLESGPLAQMLSQQGTDFTIEEINVLFDGAALRGARVKILPRLARAIARVRFAVQRAGYGAGEGIVLLNSLRATVLFRLGCFGRDQQTVIMIRDGLRPPYLSRMEAGLSQLLLRGKNVTLVANSRWTASTVSRSGHRPIHVISPMIDEAFYSVRKQSSRRSGRARVLILGRFSPWKGQDIALKACSVSGSEFDVTCAGTSLFGEEDYENYCRQIALAQANRREISFVGHVGDVVSLVDDHDIILHTSVAPEPFGQVVLQGMARSKVVIASRGGGPSELIDDGVNGFLHTPGDVAELAFLLGDVVSNLADLEDVRRSARSQAEEHSPWKSAEKLAHIFANLGPK